MELTSPLGDPGLPSPTPTGSSSCPDKFIYGISGQITDKIRQLLTPPSISFIAVGWKDFQPNAGSTYDFSSLDNQINSIIAAGQIPAVRYCDGDCFPDWARQMDLAVERSYCCTTDYVCRVLKEDSATVQAFKDAVTAMVTRYKDKINQWDYGLEPNCRGYSPSQYTTWLKYFSEAVRAVDPNATIIGGHLSSGAGSVQYLQGMYDAGAKPYFDKFAIDPYGEPLDYSALDGN